MRILVALDKFKGSLTAIEAGEAVARGFSQGLPDTEFVFLPLADGGEGTAEVFARSMGGAMVEAACLDALGRPVQGRYGWVPTTRTAIVEMSEASGMWRLRKDELDPLRTSTCGTGELILDAIARGAERVLVGLGGSATNDGGAGMAAALGFQFLDDADLPVDPTPAHLSGLARISSPPSRSIEFVAISDVRNPLLGPTGATTVYGSQKGASSTDQEILEQNLTHLADIVQRDLGCDFRDTPGAGAAGGLGFGLLSFCQARIEPGFDAFAEMTSLDATLARCDLVITGEGLLDAQTLHGKGPAGLAERARATGKPVIALAGALGHEDELATVFDAAFSIAPGPLSLEESMHDASVLLMRAAARVARLIACSKSL